MKSWFRSKIELGQLWLSPEGEVHRVVAIADQPTVTLVDVRGVREKNFVITSPLFAEWKRLDEMTP